MPITGPGSASVLIPNLASTGNIGTGMPQLATGIGTGLSLWTPTIRVATVDVGTAGVGVGSLPLVVPQPALYGFLIESMAATAQLGPLGPLFQLGLANGLVAAFVQGLILTTHPSVGTGSAVARFFAPPASVPMVQGFSMVGMVGSGPVKFATAIGLALSKTFAALTLPMPIVGSASTSGSSGLGSGGII